jgi:uncharacterized phage protein gp47/JayE
MSLKFFDTTAETLYKQYCEKLQTLTGEKMYEGDERLVFAQCMFTVIVALFNTFNEKSKSRMLRYAYGEILDAIGEFKDCYRLEPSKAVCTVRFNTSTARNNSITIPKGTRVSDGNYTFKTLEKCVLEVGKLSVSVEAESEVGGTKCNGIPVGSLSTMVDNIVGITGCTNTTVSSGGDNGEPYPYDVDNHPDGDDGEGDERYRERIRLANSAYSCAGSENAYIYWAKSASSDIVDVRVISEQQAGTIELVIMTKDGTPSDDLIEKVLSICSADDIRPMNDIVTVVAPEIITYDIEIEYTVMDGNQAQAIADLTGENGACNRFAEYTGGKLGRDINPDLLHLYCMQSSVGDTQGAVWSCKILAPLPQELTSGQVAKWSGNVLLHEPTVKFEE